MALLVSVLCGLIVGYWGWTIRRPSTRAGDDVGWIGLVRYTVMRRCLPVLAIVLVCTAAAAVARRVVRLGFLRSRRSRTVRQDPCAAHASRRRDERLVAPHGHQLRTGRPDLRGLVSESAASAATCGNGRLTVVACGPTGLVQAARNAVKTVISSASDSDSDGRHSIKFVGADPDW